MPIVVADTGPLNYLILIGHIGVLPVLFESVILPTAVRDELAAPRAPSAVRNWIATPPPWLSVRQAILPQDSSLAGLDAGESAAIALAIACEAELLLMDDRSGVNMARSRGFKVAGTLAILAMAARRGLVDLADAFERLKHTNFHYRQEIMDGLLDDQVSER